MTILIGSNAVQRWTQEIHRGNFGWRRGWMVLKDTKSFIQSVARGWSNQYFYARLSDCLCVHKMPRHRLFIWPALLLILLLLCPANASFRHITILITLDWKANQEWLLLEEPDNRLVDTYVQPYFLQIWRGPPNENFLGQLEHVFHMPDAQATAVTSTTTTTLWPL